MEYQKFIRMRKIISKASSREHYRHYQSYLGFWMFLLFAAFGVGILQQVMPPHFSLTLENATYKIVGGMNSNALIGELAGNTTKLATVVLGYDTQNLQLLGFLVGTGFILFGWILTVWFNGLIEYPITYSQDMRDARRKALFKEGYTQKDIDEYKKEVEKQEEWI